MATIIHIIVSLVVAILRAFVGAIVALFSRAALGLGVLAGVVVAVLAFSGTLGACLKKRRD